MRYKGAISDTDILINLAKADSLNILELLFQEIVIPRYIFDSELTRKAGRYSSVIGQAINKEDSTFKVLDRHQDAALNMLAKEVIEDKKKVIGPGESECAGYARALMLPIIISDNYTEFKWLDEFITLTHRNILVLCVYFGHITKEIGSEIFNTINNQLQRPTGNTFEYFVKQSMDRFTKNGWNEFLRIDKPEL